jgi:hypothetical protein
MRAFGMSFWNAGGLGTTAGGISDSVAPYRGRNERARALADYRCNAVGRHITPGVTEMSLEKREVSLQKESLNRDDEDVSPKIRDVGPNEVEVDLEGMEHTLDGWDVTAEVMGVCAPDVGRSAARGVRRIGIAKIPAFLDLKRQTVDRASR